MKLTNITVWGHKLVEYMHTWLTKYKNRQIQEPPNNTAVILLGVFFTVLFIVAIFWSIFVTPNIDIISARWVLSAQTQATAAILGLLIAAMIFT